MAEQTYPTPWYFDPANLWITRDTEEDFGEIAMAFAVENIPDDDVMELILTALNRREKAKASDG